MISERDRIGARAFREFVEAEQRAAQEERERPIREAERQLAETVKELGKLTREKIQSGRDDEFVVDLAVANAKMSISEASRFNAEQARIFRENNPDFYPSESNRAALFDFLLRNGVQIANAETFRAAFTRLRDYGLLEAAPAPEPIPEPEPIPVPIPEPGPKGMTGWDAESGEQRFFSDYEIDRMSADEFKRAFRVVKSEQKLVRTRW